MKKIKMKIEANILTCILGAGVKIIRQLKLFYKYYFYIYALTVCRSAAST